MMIFQIEDILFKIDAHQNESAIIIIAQTGGGGMCTSTTLPIQTEGGTSDPLLPPSTKPITRQSV